MLVVVREIGRRTPIGMVWDYPQANAGTAQVRPSVLCQWKSMEHVKGFNIYSLGKSAIKKARQIASQKDADSKKWAG